MNTKIIITGIGAIVVLVGGWFTYTYVTKSSDSPSDYAMNDSNKTAIESANQTQATANQVASENAGVSTHYAELDLTALPLGDGKVSSSAKSGHQYSCQTTFNGSGAQHAGDWIHGSTWNLNEKIAVSGSVSWPNAVFSNVVQGVKRLLTGNGLPVGSKTGTFPIQQSDLAYQYDRNPNSIKSHTVNYSVPTSPTFANSPSCTPMGAIGVALNGVGIYNALDAAGRDAVAHEVQDSCDGHPQGAGEYHYHGPSPCMPNIDKRNTVVGYALDGFAITSLYDANGNLYTNADLDECHGTTSSYTDENGTSITAYHYVLTWEYPYIIGCFRGTPIKTAMSGSEGAGQQQSQGTGGTPPQGAITACSGKTTNASCSFSAPNGAINGTCRSTLDGSFACVP